MSRGHINLSGHPLAGLFRPPALRSHWFRKRPDKCPDAQYRQIWRIVDGAVRDTFACHPEYLTAAGKACAQGSVTKRVTGALHGYATQVARGRSEARTDASAMAAASGRERLLTSVRLWQRLALTVRQWRVRDLRAPEISRGTS